MSSQGEVAALIKIGNKVHIEQLVESGLIYMNTLQYFRQIEDGDLRGDIDDSAYKRVTFDSGTVTLDSGKKIKVLQGIYREDFFENPEQINLFCMYAFRPFMVKESYPINEKNFCFGDTAAVFYDSQEIMQRLSQYAKDNGLMYEAGLVKYVNEKSSEIRGPYVKSNSYSYQNEWRAIVHNGDGEVRKIKLGNLSDICNVVPISELNKHFTFHADESLVKKS